MATREYRWRHLALLICILLLFISAPFVDTSRYGVVIINRIAAVVLITASYALSERKYLFTIAIVLSVISVAATGLVLAFRQHWGVIASHCFLIFSIGFFAVSFSGYVLRSGRVTTDKIFAAVCVYLLIGFAWTFAYALLEEIASGSFAAVPEMGRNDPVARVQRLRYFSFVTLTTVGYGDILPRSLAARTMAVLEAVMGQIYLTVLVARLVGLHIVHSHVSQLRDKD